MGRRGQRARDNMESQSARKISFIFLLSIVSFLCSCALFFGDEDPVKKDTSIHFLPPSEPFKKIDAAGADSVWQSKTTGNTIALNTSCKKNDDRDLKTLEENILLGIENLKIKSEKEIQVDGKPAQRVLAEGSTEGVPVLADLLILKKGDCTYDLDYIARSHLFEEEHKHFDKFITGFHTP